MDSSEAKFLFDRGLIPLREYLTANLKKLQEGRVAFDEHPDKDIAQLPVWEGVDS